MMRKGLLLLGMLALLSKAGYAQGYQSKGTPLSSGYSYGSSTQVTEYESKMATGETYKQRDNYVHVGFADSDMAQKNVQTLKNYAGFTVSVGRTFSPYSFYLNDACRFGIDATWLDFEYTGYKVEYHYPASIVKDNYGQFDFGVQVGPSFIIEPSRTFRIHAYCRYAPTYSLFCMNDDSYGSLGHFLVAGVNLSYRVVGVGVEGRWGVCNYSDLYENGLLFTSEKVNHRGVRAYLKFNF